MKLTLTGAIIAALSITVLPIGAAAAGAASRVTSIQPSHAMVATTPAARSTTLGPTRTGQPNQSCGSATAPNTPGNAAQAPGSAFNPSGHAGTVYAGQQSQNSRNVASVSQYDVACLHQR
jgi:hypothetical protein